MGQNTSKPYMDRSLRNVNKLKTDKHKLRDDRKLSDFTERKREPVKEGKKTVSKHDHEVCRNVNLYYDRKNKVMDVNADERSVPKRKSWDSQTSVKTVASATLNHKTSVKTVDPAMVNHKTSVKAVDPVTVNRRTSVKAVAPVMLKNGLNVEFDKKFEDFVRKIKRDGYHMKRSISLQVSQLRICQLLSPFPQCHLPYLTY